MMQLITYGQRPPFLNTNLDHLLTYGQSMDHTTLPKFEEYLQIYILLHLAFIFLIGGTERQAGRGEGMK